MEKEFDHSFLLSRMYQCRYNVKTLSEAIPLSRTTLYSKLKSETKFNQTEIKKICELLEIPSSEISSYFFKPKVRKTELKEDENEQLNPNSRK